MTPLQSKLREAHDARAIDALRRDVEVYRLALQQAVHQLHANREKLLNVKEENLHLRTEVHRLRMESLVLL